MDEAFAKKLKSSLDNMRAKVIAAKGEGVEGLSPLPEQKNRPPVSQAKDRGANS